MLFVSVFIYDFLLKGFECLFRFRNFILDEKWSRRGLPGLVFLVDLLVIIRFVEKVVFSKIVFGSDASGYS